MLTDDQLTFIEYLIGYDKETIQELFKKWQSLKEKPTDGMKIENVNFELPKKEDL